MSDATSPEHASGEARGKDLDKLKRLAKRNFAQFAVAIQHVSEEVQIKLIEQLPEFRKLATDAIESLSKSFNATLRANEKSEESVHRGFDEWRSALLTTLDQPDLSLDDKLRVAALIGETVREQSKFDAGNKTFKKDLFAKVAMVALGAVGLVAITLTGGKMMLGDDDKEV